MLQPVNGRGRKIGTLVQEVRESVKDKPMFADSWHAKIHNVSITFVENVRRTLKIPSVKEQRQESIRKGEQWHHRAGIVINNKEFGTWTDEEMKVKPQRSYTKTEQYWTRRVRKINKKNAERFHEVRKMIKDEPNLTLKEIANELGIPYYFAVSSSKIILAGLADEMTEHVQFFPLVKEAQHIRGETGDNSRRRIPRKTQKRR